jgi:hypothetical protein
LARGAVVLIDYLGNGILTVVINKLVRGEIAQQKTCQGSYGIFLTVVKGCGGLPLMVFLFPLFFVRRQCSITVFCRFHITFGQIISCNDLVMWWFCTVNRIVNTFLCYNGWPYSIKVCFLISLWGLSHQCSSYHFHICLNSFVTKGKNGPCFPFLPKGKW